MTKDEINYCWNAVEESYESLTTLDHDELAEAGVMKAITERLLIVMGVLGKYSDEIQI